MNRDQYFAGRELQCDLTVNDLAVKFDAEIPDGFISGTASTPSVDLHGHRVLPGAFDEAIKNRGFEGGQGIKLLAYHDRTKVAGMIKQLQTVNDRLKIAANLFLNVGYVKDLYEVSKQTKGLNFSVGFKLQDFKFVDDEKDGDILVVEKGDLIEVSIVAFPAQPEAKMEFIKSVDSPSEFEKALIANGWAMSRREAHQLMQLCRNSIHLLDRSVLIDQAPTPKRPLDVSALKACSDLALKAKTLLGAR